MQGGVQGRAGKQYSANKRDRSADRLREMRMRDDDDDHARLVYFDLGMNTDKTTKTIDYVESDYLGYQNQKQGEGITLRQKQISAFQNQKEQKKAINRMKFIE